MKSLPPSGSVFEAKGQITAALGEAWNRGAIESTPLTLVLVSFDTTAKTSGVEMLERAMKVHCARAKDVVLRRTHDEFVAILPDTPPSGARRLGEQIVEAMRAADDDHSHRVSVGVAVAVPDDLRAPADFLRRAENALQAARDNGGDRCVGGTAAASDTPPESKGPFALLSQLIPRKSDPDRKRGTD